MKRGKAKWREWRVYVPVFISHSCERGQKHGLEIYKIKVCACVGLVDEQKRTGCVFCHQCFLVSPRTHQRFPVTVCVCGHLAPRTYQSSWAILSALWKVCVCVCVIGWFFWLLCECEQSGQKQPVLKGRGSSDTRRPLPPSTRLPGQILTSSTCGGQFLTQNPQAIFCSAEATEIQKLGQRTVYTHYCTGSGSSLQ